MKELVEINVGDSVVDVDGWSITVRVVSAVTPKTYSHMVPRWRLGQETTAVEPRRRDRTFVVFSGPADIATRLAEQLGSSRARRESARQQIEHEKRERDARFIAEAMAEAARQKHQEARR